MTQEHNLRVSARTVELTAADEDADGDNWRFGGVAVGENDILYTDDGTPVLFSPEVLAEYAETQRDEPLSIDHPRDENGEPLYPPPLENSPGRVVNAGYVPGKGLVYEATTHDEDIAAGVRGSSYRVSVHPSFDLGEQDPDTGAYIPKNVDFLDLSLVSKGMSPNNTAEWGANAALASWTRQADIGAEIEAQATPDEEPPNWFQSWAEKLGLTASADGETADGEQESDESAESGAGEGSENTPDDPNMTDPEDNPDGEGQEQTPDEGENNGGETDPGEGADEPQTLGDMTVDELGSALRDQGFVTQEDAGDLFNEVEAQKQKGELVDEIIAESDDYDEDDREELMASANSLIESEHERLTSTTGAHLPGSAGARASVTASADDDDLDKFGTGVQE